MNLSLFDLPTDGCKYISYKDIFILLVKFLFYDKDEKVY